MNPYRVALGRARRAQGFDVVPLLSLVGGGLAGGLLQGEVYAFVPGLGSPAGASAAASLMGRLGLLLGAGLTLGTYDIVVRGPDRAVLDLHPLLPKPWYAARITESARVRLPWLLAALGALWPLRDPLVIALCAFVLAGSWFAGLGVGIGVNLAAPGVGLNPRWAGVMDAIRGVNPRLQAALLYAPGTALGIAGFGILGGAAGLGGCLRGQFDPLIFAPWALGGVGLVLGRHNASAAARLPALLGEIDAAYAHADAPDEAHRVYLEWGVRFLPASLQPHVLRELRHVWRGQRGWATGAFGLAILAAFAGWSGQTWLALALVAVVCGLGLKLTEADPAWVADSLGVSAARVRWARTLAVTGVAGPVSLAGGIAGALGGGGIGGIVVVGASAVLAAIAVRAGRAYVPIALLVVGIAAGGGLVGCGASDGRAVPADLPARPWGEGAACELGAQIAPEGQRRCAGVAKPLGELCEDASCQRDALVFLHNCLALAADDPSWCVNTRGGSRLWVSFATAGCPDAACKLQAQEQRLRCHPEEEPGSFGVRNVECGANLIPASP